MYEYWIFNNIPTALLNEGLECEAQKMNVDCFCTFQAKNVFVIHSCVSYADGNYMLDQLLDRLAKYYDVHDKGIIKSHWQTSGFH